MLKNNNPRRPWRKLNVRRAARMRPMILLWALGVPLPIVLLIYLFSGGC